MALSSRALALAGILGATGVAAGAFGAHGLKGFVAPAQLDVWKTAAHYQLVHALALMALGLFKTIPNDLTKSIWLRRAALCWAIGILLFSGSLYLLVLASIPALGLITPIGGVLLIAGWLSLLIAARNDTSS